MKASHILLKTKEEAEKVLERIKDGEDFNTLAKQLSTDPGSRDKGGELGYFMRGQMKAAFETAAFAMKPGEVSGIVQTDAGYHIYKVEDVKLEKLEDIKDELRNTLANNKKDTEYKNLLADMKSKVTIEKFIKNL